jgi:hypothetical protein
MSLQLQAGYGQHNELNCDVGETHLPTHPLTCTVYWQLATHTSLEPSP